jgi:histone deacetylase complex regulatory component SIN3
MHTEIRTYTLVDKENIIGIFYSNCPRYFDKNDLQYLIEFLDNYADNNFKVLIHNNEVIGCGGHYVKHTEKVFGIAWVMFRRFSIGQVNFLKITTQFFNHILTNIENEKLDFDIVINTTQLLEKTFNKFYFWTERIIENGFGENLDNYVMRRKLTNKKTNA